MTVEELEIVITANITDAMAGIEKVTAAVQKAVKGSITPMNKIATQAKSIAGNSASSFKVMTNSIKNVKNNIISTTAQQQILIDKINDMKADLSTMSAKELTSSVGTNLRAEIEKSEQSLYKLQGAGAKTNTTLDKGFKGLKKTVKRFALGMLSVRSVISLISKAMRSYLSTNDAANKKYQITTNILGQVLAPAMEKLLDLVQYLTIGVALLIKMFTGFDALAKVTTADLQDASDTAKDLNNQLTSIDEITNLSDNSTADSLATDYNALLDFQKKVEEVEKLFKDWKVDEFVTKLKDMSSWLWENRDAIIKVGIALAAVFATAKISGWLIGIKSLLGYGAAGAAGGVGLIGLATTMLWVAGIAAAGILLAITVVGIAQAISDLGKLSTAIKNNSALISGQAKTNSNFISTVGGAVSSGNYDEAKYISQLKTSISRLYDQIKAEEAAKKETYFSFWDNSDTKASNANIDALKSQIAEMNAEIKRVQYSKMATGGVLTKPTYGLMGEYPDAKSNPEIVSPQSIMKDTMMDAFAQILPSMQSSNGGGEAILNINGQELARAMFNDNQNEANRRNTSTSIKVS